MVSLRSFVAFTALVIIACAVAVPASANTTTVTGSVNPIVEWNAATTGTLNLYPNYVASTGVTNGSGIGSVVAATNAGYTGASGCTAAPAQTSNIIDFMNVSVPTGTNTTACDYQNALSINVSTNDTTGWNVTQNLQLAPGAGFTLCAILNGSLYSGTPRAAAPMGASSATGSSASINETSCAGSQETLGKNNTTPTTVTPITNQTTAGTFFQGEDVLLLLTSTTISVGSYTANMTVTLTLN